MEHLIFHYAEIIIFCVMFAGVIAGAWLLFSHALSDFKRAKELDRDKRD